MARQKVTLASTIKHKFDYDVSDLEAYVDEQSPDIMTDLVYSAGLTSRISVMQNNKGSEKIKLLESNPTIQAASTCGWTPTGGIVLTDVTLTTVRLKIQEEYCNENLNDTWGQLMNAAGANQQDKEAPFADIMLAYYMKKARAMNQDLMVKGDTTSINPNLNKYDGFLKKWAADADVEVYTSTETTITNANAFEIALGLYNTIDPVLFDNGINLEIMVGRETYRKIIGNVYNDNNFHSTLTEEAGVEPSFTLPTTNIRVRAYSQLNGTDEMIVAPYNYMFWGTDLENDIDGFEFKYNEHDEKLRFSVKWRSGINYVFPQYFTRLELAAS